MPQSNLILTLAKVLIAAAWADGEVTNDEVNSLKDLLFQLPGLTARDWAALEIYIDSPIEPAERDRLVGELQATISSSSDKALALQTLEEIIQADKVVTEEEAAVVEEIKVAIDAAHTGMISQMGRLLRGPVQRRGQALANTPNRELYLEDFQKNQIYYQVRRRLNLGEAELNLPESDLRKLSLAGGLLARVAHVDQEVTDGEFAAIAETLGSVWSLTKEAAAFVTEVAISTFSADMDFFRLTREFFTATTHTERVHFLDALFAVAIADGGISHEETEEIRIIARGLKLTHKQFIQAKLGGKK